MVQRAGAKIARMVQVSQPFRNRRHHHKRALSLAAMTRSQAPSQMISIPRCHLRLWSRNNMTMARLNKNQQPMDPRPTIRSNCRIEIRLYPPDCLTYSSYSPGQTII
jgi:hypothetical protein